MPQLLGFGFVGVESPRWLAGLFPEISSCPTSDKDFRQRKYLKLSYDGEQRKTTNALLRTLFLSLPDAGYDQRCIQCRGSGVENGERKVATHVTPASCLSMMAWEKVKKTKKGLKVKQRSSMISTQYCFTSRSTVHLQMHWHERFNTSNPCQTRASSWLSPVET